MKRILALSLIASSALLGCQTLGPQTTSLRDDAICSLRPITVSPEVRVFLQAPVQEQTYPQGYERFLRDIAAHNAKLHAHCGPAPLSAS